MCSGCPLVALRHFGCPDLLLLVGDMLDVFVLRVPCCYPLACTRLWGVWTPTQRLESEGKKNRTPGRGPLVPLPCVAVWLAACSEALLVQHTCLQFG